MPKRKDPPPSAVAEPTSAASASSVGIAGTTIDQGSASSSSNNKTQLTSIKAEMRSLGAVKRSKRSRSLKTPTPDPLPEQRRDYSELFPADILPVSFSSELVPNPRAHLKQLLLQNSKSSSSTATDVQEQSPTDLALRQVRGYEDNYLDRKFDLSQLLDDVVAKSLYSGLLNRSETLQLSTQVSKRLSSIASQAVQTLDLSHSKKLTNGDLKNLVQRYPNVTTLNLSYCPKLTSKAVLELIPLEKLQHLNLQGTKVLGSDMIEYLEKSTSSSSLETLNLSAVRKEDSSLIGDACVQAIATCCPNLQSLQLAWCKAVTDEGVQHLAQLQKLQELDLNLTCITSRSISTTILKLKTLSSLDVSATGVDIDGIAQLCLAPTSSIRYNQTTKLPLVSLKLGFLEDLHLVMVEKLLSYYRNSLERLDVSFSGYDQRLEAPACWMDEHASSNDNNVQVKVTGIHWT